MVVRLGLNGWVMTKRIYLTILFCLVSITVASKAQTGTTAISILPPNPTSSDSIQVQVEGGLFDLCWRTPHQIECRIVQPNILLMDIYAIDAAETLSVCLQSVLPYEAACSYGTLEVGDYVLIVTEHHDSWRRPEPDTAIERFQVSAVTPTTKLTWTKIKARYGN